MPNDPFAMTTPAGFWNNPYSFTVPEPPPTPKPTKLLPGDVRTLIAVMDGTIQNSPLTPATRQNFLAILGRLRNTTAEHPPSIPAAMCAWFDAFTVRDHERLLKTGNALLDAVVLSGDMNGAAALQESLQRYTQTMTDYLMGVQPKGDEDADAGGAIQWITPDPKMFYSTGSEAGRLLLEAIEDIRHADACVARGCPPPTRMLFDGPPGTGKTVAAQWIAAQLGRTLAVIKLAGLVSKYIGETGSRFDLAAKQARAKGAVLLVDELDTVGGHREEAEGGAGDHTAKAVGAINQTLDQMPPEMLIIGATNLPTSVDPSVARRFETRIPFGYPDQASREVMLREWWGKAPYSAEAFAELVRRTDGRSGDALRRAAHAANRKAIRRGAEASIEIGDVVGVLATLTKEAAIGDGRSTSGLILAGR